MSYPVYAITALRWQGPDEIEEAMMGLLDLDAMQWALAPAPTRTTTVIDRLLDGDRVVTWVQDQGCGRLGPKVQVGLSAAGRETLTLVDEPGSTAAPTRLEDLPRF